MAEMLKERGVFWWFNEPNLPARSKETSVAGLLTITDEGQITLEADGSLCLKDECRDWAKPRTLPQSRRIAGLLASSSDYVLLQGLERTDFSLGDELPQQQRFDAQMCSRRDSPFPETYGPDNFIELRIELTGFEEWLELDSIVVHREYNEGEGVNVRVSYKEWKLKYSGVGGSISIESITTGAPILLLDVPRREAKFSQHYYLVFKADSPSDISGLHYTYTKFEEFLALLTGTYSRLAWPILVSKEVPFDAWNTLHFYRSAPSAQAISRYSIWVSFPSVRETFGELFRNWIFGSESFGAGFYLYVSSLRSPHYYSEDRFVNLVWGIEALHRKWLGESQTSERVVNERKRVSDILGLLPEGSEDRKWLGKKLAHAHEPSLEARILECLRKLPFSFGRGEIEKFAKACAQRRNDISHAGGPREDVDYTAFHLEISSLADALDHLFHALLLHQIGVEPKVILEVMTHSIVSERIMSALANAGLLIKGTAHEPQGARPTPPRG
jgi:HEPN superfamily Apea-like protein/ApeA-like protein